MVSTRHFEKKKMREKKKMVLDFVDVDVGGRVLPFFFGFGQVT